MYDSLDLVMTDFERTRPGTRQELHECSASHKTAVPYSFSYPWSVACQIQESPCVVNTDRFLDIGGRSALPNLNYSETLPVADVVRASAISGAAIPHVEVSCIASKIDKFTVRQTLCDHVRKRHRRRVRPAAR